MEGLLEQPISLDFSASGRVGAVDRGGRRLCIRDPDGEPHFYDTDFEARRCRFCGESLVVLGEPSLLVTMKPGGERGPEARLRAGALNLAVTRSGSLLVSYGRRGATEHGVTLERIGPSPLTYTDRSVLDATALAVESGGFWIAGTGSDAPASRAVQLRPVPDNLSVRRVVALPAPPRAASIGPDGALYVILEPGESMVRVFAGAAGPVQRLPEPATDIARGEQSLVACGPRGLCDLTAFVPLPAGDGPQLRRPSCPP